MHNFCRMYNIFNEHCDLRTSYNMIKETGGQDGLGVLLKGGDEE